VQGNLLGREHRVARVCFTLFGELRLVSSERPLQVPERAPVAALSSCPTSRLADAQVLKSIPSWESGSLSARTEQFSGWYYKRGPQT
jgi:hypothetical protein